MPVSLAAALLAGLAAAALDPTKPIEVLEAGNVEYDVANDRGVATGGVVLRRGAVVVRADSATYDARTGEVEARGGVLLTEPGVAVGANSLHAILDGPYEARDVVAFVKEGPLDLSRCRTLEEGRKTGRNQFTLGGAEVRGDSHDPAVEVKRARVTLCDCGDRPASWEIRSRSASVVPGHHVWLRLPVLYITPRFLFLHRKLLGVPGDPAPIPILAFPVGYLPLGDRQSGLLIPDLALGGVNGTVLSQPLFLTLGRSYDLTLTPNYTFGSSDATVAAQHRGVKGFGGVVEGRWAPVEGAFGRARLFLQHSTIEDWPGGAWRPPGMNRIALSLVHDQRLSDRTRLEVDAGLVGDAYYVNDFTSDALLRAAEYRRSGVALTHRRDDLLLEADIAYHESLVGLDACVGAATCPVRAPFGLFGSSVPTFHRLPSASAMLLPVRLAGPLRLSATAGVARFAPIHGSTGDEGADGIGPGDRPWSSSKIDAGEGDGRWEPGERLAATRAVVRAEASAPFTLGFLGVEPRLVGTAAAYAFGGGVSAQADARAVAGLSLWTDVSRTFGTGAGRIRHDIEPRVEWRAGTSQAGPGLPSYAYDELDVAPPLAAVAAGQTVPVRRTLSAEPGSFNQLQLSVRNRLSKSAGALSATALELTLGQDLDLSAGKLSETWARVAWGQPLLKFLTLGTEVTARFLAFGARRAEGTGPASLDASGNVIVPPKSPLDAFTSLQASVTLSDPRGDNVHAGLFAVGAGGSPRLLAGLEPFFDPRPVAADPLAQGSFGAVAHLSGATVTWDAAFYARELASKPCSGSSTSPHVYQHVVTFVWDSPCKCWKAGVTFVSYECDPAPRFGFVFDLSSLSQRHVGM